MSQTYLERNFPVSGHSEGAHYLQEEIAWQTSTLIISITTAELLYFVFSSLNVMM